jgi:hypothetical protein
MAEGDMMARKWSAESLNMSKASDSLEPLPAPLLSPEQIRVKRAELACEMVELLLGESDLKARPRRTLEDVYSSLRKFRRQL